MRADASFHQPAAGRLDAFYGGPAVVRTTGAVVRALNRLSPALGARAARRLFLTPLPTKWSQRRPVPDHWRTERWAFEQGALVSYHRRAADAARPRVLLVHEALLPQVAQPALVVHDTDDRVAPLAQGEALVRGLPQARLLRTQGLGHRRLLRDAQVLQQALQHLATDAEPGQR